MKEELIVAVSGEDYERLANKASDVGCTPNQLIQRIIRATARERNIWDNPFINDFLSFPKSNDTGVSA